MQSGVPWMDDTARVWSCRFAIFLDDEYLTLGSPCAESGRWAALERRIEDERPIELVTRVRI